jgi:pimeloyl-ACP methyl ester carboxylesterase
MDIVDIQVDVAAAVDSPLVDSLFVRGSVFLPSPAEPVQGTVLICAAGRSYDRRYFHPPGQADYSFATYAAARGHAVAAYDYLGVGDSDDPADIEQYTSARLAAANHAFASDVLARTRAGQLGDGLPPIPYPFAIGVGHSMGGFLTVRQQALHHTFDAVASLGWGLDLNLHFLDGVDTAFAATQDDAALLSIPGVGAFVEQSLDRAAFRELFYWEDVPEEAIAADQAVQTRSLGLAGAGALVPDFSRKDVASIDVPVFLAFGERDVSANPRREPSFYASALDITLLVLARSAHCHNFASSRHHLWGRLLDWAASVAGDEALRRPTGGGTGAA